MPAETLQVGRCAPRVLVVDNKPEFRALLKDLLLGYDVTAVEAQWPEIVTSAENLARKVRPHVIIFDLKLKPAVLEADRTGLELLQNPIMTSAKRILYSAYLRDDFRISVDATAAGAVAVIEKAEMEHLVTAVTKAADSHCACRKAFSSNWPPGWTPDLIVRTLFGDDTDVPSSIVEEVLCQLFSDADSVTLTELADAGDAPTPFVAGRSIVFQARSHDREPVIIKLAPSGRIDREVAAYKTFVTHRLRGNYFPQLQGHATFWDLGAISYALIGSSSNVHTFASFYRRESDLTDIVQPLRHFFMQVWYSNYRAPGTITPLAASYNRIVRLHQRVESFAHAVDLAFPEIGKTFPHPGRWVLEHLDESGGVREVICHGDFNADNLLVDDGRAWPIDFERTGRGPITCDPGELEQDILTRVVQLVPDDWQSFLDLLVAVTAPRDLRESIVLPVSIASNPEATKASQVIEKLRALVFEASGPVDVREYYWALLLHALVAATVLGDGSAQGRRRWLLAAVVCQRLADLSVVAGA